MILAKKFLNELNKLYSRFLKHVSIDFSFKQKKKRKKNKQPGGHIHTDLLFFYPSLFFFLNKKVWLRFCVTFYCFTHVVLITGDSGNMSAPPRFACRPIKMELNQIIWNLHKNNNASDRCLAKYGITDLHQNQRSCPFFFFRKSHVSS